MGFVALMEIFPVFSETSVSQAVRGIQRKLNLLLAHPEFRKLHNAQHYSTELIYSSNIKQACAMLMLIIVRQLESLVHSGKR